MIRRIDYTVGLKMPQMGDVALGLKMPKIGDQSLGKRMGVDPPHTADEPIRPRHPAKGGQIDVMA
ncbi:MAG: hypothetical protein HN712_03795 [Gemmatimonadetes bacterium]|nr:hypothetical protein [Gemmatimonadota bacterium]MBT6149883.1 hypothetical protein [Gemmatimonadota bacterium]MBT7859404.1 hypothetical protein [Gemmatimonadota bacterium]